MCLDRLILQLWPIILLCFIIYYMIINNMFDYLQFKSEYSFLLKQGDIYRVCVVIKYFI